MDHSTAWIRAALESGREVVLYENQYRQPTWALTLAMACLELAINNFRGILNIAGSQVMNRAEYGLKLLDWWGIKRRKTLIIGPTEDRWPQDTRLELTLAEEVLNTPLLGFDAVLNAHGQRRANQ
jgi:dTDP-4-dehydrorhamnose reductase